MNVTNAWVDWNAGYDTPPKLHVRVDGDVADRDDLTFRSTNNRSFWWAENDGIYWHFAGHPDRPGDGYTGDEFVLNTEDGQITLVGPYSSRAGALNAYGIAECVAVHLHAPNIAGRPMTVSLDIAQQAADIVGVTLERVERSLMDSEYVFEVVESHPPEWEWSGERKRTRDIPWGEGTFEHPDGSRIDVDVAEWTEERRIGSDINRTVFRSTLFDADGEVIYEGIARRADKSYICAMGVHDDSASERDKKHIEQLTERYRDKFEEKTAGTP